ncbi:MAG: Htur_1727 family rSAM-partnered candidate RiPP [Halobacteriaceae archaeon]
MEPPDRSRVGDHPRDDTETEWEVFVREDTADPMRHVGSVTAPSADVAHERATRLFGWYADDVWLVAAGDVARFSTHDLDDDAEPAPVAGDGAEPRTYEP